MRIESIGERIKKSRKKVGLTQKGVAGGEIKRETISLIETGNTKKITKKTIAIIVKNINKAAEENDMDYRITEEELLKEESDIIEELIEDQLKELKVLLMSKSSEIRTKLNEIETMFKDVPEEKKEKIYENVIDYFLDNRELEEAKTYILKCYAIASKKNENEKLIKTIYKLISIYTKRYDYKQVIKLMEHAERIAEFSNLKKDDYMKKIYFHSAMAFRKNGEYKECIYLLEKIKTIFSLTNNEILDTETVLGRCYEKIKEYKKAENIFLNILNLSIDTEYILMVALAYTNLAYVHFKQMNQDLAKEYIDKARKINIKDFDKMAEIYYRAFEIYSFDSKNFSEVEEMFYDAIHKATIVKNEKLEIKIINMMIEYCIREVKEDEILKILASYESEIDSSQNSMKIYFKSYAFLKDIKSKMSDIIFEKCRNSSGIIDDDI